ncbi:MAG TPA: amidase family protein [Phenylobacterium sp.]|jgi:amidase|uniref:amidase family protein n=1 Tax=Phenylobacterium sp. TaxID=1871053 RepID=UPI002D33A62F|nr:amidase family protein [Phenylobacterium sp.]HZZ69707.1 amidase family protein [Phenylobacterium sp.]
MASTDIWQWSAVETAAAIRARQVSAVEVATAHIARLHAANPALNAVVVDLTDSALETARACDRAQAAGADLDILHGVPVTLKINIDIAGQANSNGVVGLADNIAPGDSPIAANVRGAGAVILGLTNTPEFSLRAFTDNPLHGLTLNPWDPAITCGGSSGGAAASLAAGIGAIAHGNDIGGSLRGPAHCCGLSTIKATQGRMPAFNPGAAVERPLMAQLMSTQGPLGREVADVRLGLEVMSRRDPRDTWQAPAPLVGPPVNRPIKVAVAPIPPDMQADPAVLALIRQAADHLADAGYAVAEVATPDISVAWRLWADLIATEIETLQAAQMRAMGGADFNRALDGFVKLATLLDGEGYMKTLALRARIVREWVMFLEDWPLMLTPVSVKPPWAVNADLGGDAAVREIFWNDFRFTSALSVLGLPAAATPVGLVGGHPVGVQIVGQRFREDLCLDAAAAIEARVGVLTHQLWARE